MTEDKKLNVKDLVHDLDSVRANMTACLRNLSADRRSTNPYAELGFETLGKLNAIIARLNNYDSSDKKGVQ